MQITLRWTNKALSDLARLYDFLAQADTFAAVKILQTLTKAPNILLSTPRMGTQLSEFTPREVRRMLIGYYELRYEIQESTIYILRLWHTKEHR